MHQQKRNGYFKLVALIFSGLASEKGLASEFSEATH